LPVNFARWVNASSCVLFRRTVIVLSMVLHCNTQRKTRSGNVGDLPIRDVKVTIRQQREPYHETHASSCGDAGSGSRF
jgi:hypothetical protein